jgi:hypothetical protein
VFSRCGCRQFVPRSGHADRGEQPSVLRAYRREQNSLCWRHPVSPSGRVRVRHRESSTMMVVSRPCAGMPFGCLHSVAPAVHRRPGGHKKGAMPRTSREIAPSTPEAFPHAPRLTRPACRSRCILIIHCRNTCQGEGQSLPMRARRPRTEERWPVPARGGVAVDSPEITWTEGAARRR